MDEKSFGQILNGIFWMVLISYIVPVLLVAGIVYGSGLLTGYLLWHH